MGGAEQLHLSGLSGDYRASIKGNELTLIHAAQRTAVKLAAGRGPGRLVFEDGFVGMGNLWRNMAEAVALCRLTGDAGLTSSATVASYVHPGRDGVFFAESHALPQGALLSVASLDRMESVYEPDVAAPICLDGAFSDYGVIVQGAVVALDRQMKGRVESVYLVDAEELSFSDGAVSVTCTRRKALPQWCAS